MTVDLVPSWTLGNLSLTSYPFGVDADSTVDVGEPSMVVESVTSSLADGDLERVMRHGNRTYVLEVYIEGPTLGDLAKSEALLRSEMTRSGLTLTHDPGDGFSPASVYEVQTAQLTPQRRDDHESHLIRKFTVTLTCAPWARSAALVTVPALDSPSTPTTVLIDSADSVVGWSAVAFSGLRDGPSEYPVTVTDVGAGVSASAPGEPGLQMTFTSASPRDLTSTRYVVIEVGGKPVTSIHLNTTSGGWRRFPIVLAAATTYPTVKYVVDAPNETITAIRVQWARTGPDRQIPSMTIYDVSATDTLPQVTSRQASRTITPGGTERTPASIQVAPRASGQTLKLTIVHTSPQDNSGYSPSLRQWRTSGNAATPDAARVSGAFEPVLVNPIVAQMPLKSVPEGEYVLAALMRSSVAGTFSITYQARTFFSGSYLGGVSDTVQAKFSDAGFWTLIPLGVVTLPPVRAATSEAYVDLTLNRSPVASEVIDLDEWWAFRHGDGCALSMVASGNTSFLWLDSPDVSSAVPRVWTGVDGDRSDARHPGAALLAQGSHYLHPEGTAIFVASEGIPNAAVSATYYKRWHSNAAE